MDRRHKCSTKKRLNQVTVNEPSFSHDSSKEVIYKEPLKCSKTHFINKDTNMFQCYVFCGFTKAFKYISCSQSKPSPWR